MIYKKDLTGAFIKKAARAHKAHMRWHNKNKSYSNFGFNIYMFEEFTRETDFEITGDYNATTGEIVNLRIGPLYACGHNIPKDMYEDLEILKEYIGEYAYIRLSKPIEVLAK